MNHMKNKHIARVELCVPDIKTADLVFGVCMGLEGTKGDLTNKIFKLNRVTKIHCFIGEKFPHSLEVRVPLSDYSPLVQKFIQYKFKTEESVMENDDKMAIIFFGTSRITLISCE